MGSWPPQIREHFRKLFRSTNNYEISYGTDELTSKCVLKQIVILVAKFLFEETLNNLQPPSIIQLKYQVPKSRVVLDLLGFFCCFILSA